MIRALALSAALLVCPVAAKEKGYAQGTPMPIPPSRFAWLGPQPEPPDCPARMNFRDPGYNRLGPQPEPPDCPAIDYEFELMMEWLFGLPPRF